MGPDVFRAFLMHFKLIREDKIEMKRTIVIGIIFEEE